MRSSIITSLAILATSFCLGSALGINCQGSVFCPRSRDLSDKSIPTLRDAVEASGKPDDTVYNSGDHVICDKYRICLFPQGTSMTLGQIKPLILALYDHGCRTCGSVPAEFVTKGSNDPKAGILTFNYTRNTKCIGNCIIWHNDETAPEPSK